MINEHAAGSRIGPSRPDLLSLSASSSLISCFHYFSCRIEELVHKIHIWCCVLVYSPICLGCLLTLGLLRVLLVTLLLVLTTALRLPHLTARTNLLTLYS